jgi:K+-sensing histidine kinase KdpD
VTVVGRVGTDALDDVLVDALQEVVAEHAQSATAPQAEHVVHLEDRPSSVWAERGLDRLVLVRLGTIDQEFGVAVAGRTQEASLSTDDVSVLQMLAAQTSLAIHRTRLRRERARKEQALRERSEALQQTQAELEERVEERTQRLREYARRLEILREIDQAILAAESPSEIASAALKRLKEFVPFIRASAVLFHWDREESEILAIYQERGETDLEPGVTFPIDALPVPESLFEGEPEMVHDIDAAPATPITKRLREDENIRSYVSFPLVVEDELVGMVNFGADETGVYAGQWRHIIREVADQLAIAIRQARLVEQVKAYSEELEERVQERTEELESFTYSVSHDLRTPLRAVDGFSRMLMDRHADELGDEARRLVRVIHENTQKMSRLIDGLLSLSRLGRKEMRRRTVDVEQLVREAFDEVRPGEEEHDVEADFTVESLPPAYADRQMLRRVFVNLLSNALKFTRDEDQPRIVVGADTTAEGDPVYFVRDNGAGFDMEYADKLFGVFQRLHDEDAFEGTGVGLAIVERAIRRHDGRIWAEGAVDEGATFSFTLPGEP